MNLNPHTNRSFLYGDGFFDTLLLLEGVCKNYDLHFARNQNSARLLEMDWKNEWTIEYFYDFLKGISTINDNRYLKVRFTFFRNSEGGYSPLSNEMGFDVKTEIFTKTEYNLFKTGIYRSATKQCNFFSGIKTTSSMLYVAAALEMKRQKLDEIIILNEYGRVCESLNSNIYLEKNGIYYTPPLSEGCVDGTFRKLMIRGDLRYNVIERIIELDELKTGNIYFSNAVRGLTQGVLL